MSAPGSPGTSPRKGKYLECKVLLLDDTWHQFWIHPKGSGHMLYTEVTKHLQLLEADYFDLEFKDPQGFCCWLDHEKMVIKQLTPSNMFFKLLVKFYTPDPGLLEEEYTRYLYALQVKRDLASGVMPCQEHTAVLLASYVVQAEIGDYLEDEFVDHNYLTGLKLLPQQTDSLLIKIMEHHREHGGQNPEQADFNLLDTARKVELYGIRMHPAKDHEGVSLQLAVAHMGVLVFQSFTKINTFSWAKIRKLSFKRKKFLIKLHPEGYGYYKDTVEFYFESRNECKNFWKKCLEHHAFFRCHAVKRMPRNKTRVVSRGSSFRYSGRTQKQLVEFVRDNYVKRPPFERTTSLRTVSSTRSAAATPKTGTLNSRDIHFGRDIPHNPSTSSGSHTLDMARSSEDIVDTRAEVHDSSYNSGSRSLTSPRRNRSLDRSLDRELTRSRNHSEDHLHRETNHYQRSPPAPAPPPRDEYARDGYPGNQEGERDEFNYTYYKLSYDANSSHALTDYPNITDIQNANDNDERDFDNVSHDSYPLTDSRDSVEGELDEPYIPDGYLSKEQVELVRQGLEKERARRELEIRGAWEDTEGPGGTESDEDVHVVTVQPLERKDTDKQIELQIVEKVEKTKIIEKVERRSVFSKAHSEEDNRLADEVINRNQENLEQVRVQFEQETSNEEKPLDTAVQKASDDEQLQQDLKQDAQLQEDLQKEETDTKREVNDTKPEVNGKDLNEEIPYYLHKRHVSPSAPRNKLDQVPRVTTRGRSPSPRRPHTMVPPTKEQEKAQLNRIKTGLSEPIVPPKKSPGSPQTSKSPGMRRAFDFVVYSKLPPPDSYSSLDDSLSPVGEKNIIPLLKSRSNSTDDNLSDKAEEKESMPHEPKPLEADIDETAVFREDKETMPCEQQPLETDIDETDVFREDTHEENPAMLVLPKYEKSDDDSDLSPTAAVDMHTQVKRMSLGPDEEDVNRILSECSHEDEEDDDSSTTVSSLSDREIFDERPLVQDRVLSASEALQTPPLVPHRLVEFDEQEEDEFLEKEAQLMSDTDLTKYDDLPSPPPPPVVLHRDSMSSLDDVPPPPPPPAIFKHDICVFDITQPVVHDDSLNSTESDHVPDPACSGLDIPSICIRAATPIMASPDSPPGSPSHQSAADNAAVSVTFQEPEPVFDIELHIDEDRLMNEVAVEEALAQGQAAIDEGLSEEEAFQLIGVALANKALREALVQASRLEAESRESGLHWDDNDAPLPPPPPPPPIDSSSDSDLEETDFDERGEAPDILTNPFQVPLTGTEQLPSVPEHDISSDDDEICYDESFEVAHMSRALSEEARAKPFQVPLTGREHDPSAPQHDISSEEEDEICYDPSMEVGQMSQLLSEEARKKPFQVPLTGDEHDPSKPEHDISPGEDEEICYDHSFVVAHLSKALSEEARSKPFQVPLTGDEYDPSKPVHDISPGDDEEICYDHSMEVAQMSQMLSEEAQMKPFNVPLTGEEHDPSKPEHDISSGEDEEICYDHSFEVARMSRALSEEARSKPFSVPLTGEEHDPSKPEHDISSGEDEEICYDHSFEVAHLSRALSEEARSKPFSVPLTGDEHDPSKPEHDISSGEDEEICYDHSFEVAHMSSLLSREVTANPFQVPRSGFDPIPYVLDDDLSSDSDDQTGFVQSLEIWNSKVPSSYPIPTLGGSTNARHLIVSSDSDDDQANQHQTYQPAMASGSQGQPTYSVISSDSDSDHIEVQLEDHHMDAAGILESCALANPYSVPIAGHQPTVLDTSSDHGGQSEEDLPDILDTDLHCKAPADDVYPETDKSFSLPPLPMLQHQPSPWTKSLDLPSPSSSCSSSSDHQGQRSQPRVDDADELEALENIEAHHSLHSDESDEENGDLPPDSTQDSSISHSPLVRDLMGATFQKPYADSTHGEQQS